MVKHLTIIAAALATLTATAIGKTVSVKVFDAEVIYWNKDAPVEAERDGFVIRFEGHTVERSLTLPAAPANQRDAQRIVARVEVEPVMNRESGRLVPNDRWNRLGSITVVVPGEDGAADTELELMRFVTGYGGAGVFEQDVTPMAPLLHGDATLRAFVSTYSPDPGWRLSVTLRYDDVNVGYRRPIYAAPLFHDEHVTREESRLRAGVVIPPGLARPRLRILTTGHATDGAGGDEFVSRTHVLRIDGREIARWRPWAEDGAGLRPANPLAGRQVIAGRPLWSSDLDRSGWHPGLVVEPMIIPVPELTPGPHRIEIEIENIRLKDPPVPGAKQHHGYWVVSAVVVADEPWPGRERAE